MIASLALGVLAIGGSDREVTFVDASLTIPGELLSWKARDWDRDGRLDLMLVALAPNGRRELRVYPVQGQTIDAKPSHTMEFLQDVTAFGLAELQPSESGLELLLLSPTGAWSYSLNKSGYRNNIASLTKFDGLFDLPLSKRIGWWDYIGPGGHGVNQFLVPTLTGLQLARQTEGAWDLLEIPTTDTPTRKGTGSLTSTPRSSTGGFQVALQVEGGKLKSPFIGESSKGISTMAKDSVTLSAPAWVDFDGDGDRDLLYLTTSELLIYRDDGTGPPAEPTRREKLPAYLIPTDDNKPSLRLVDINQDDRLDILVQAKKSSKSTFSNGTTKLMVLLQTKTRMLPAKPNQTFSFAASNITAQVADIDGDEHLDLMVRQFELPDLTDMITGLEFTLTHMFYAGTGRGFEPQPTLRQASTFDEEEVEGLIINRAFKMDLSGDGLADMVEIDLQGRIAIRRLIKESGFFSGTTWALEEVPWKRFDTAGSISKLDVLDLNGDGQGDVVSVNDAGLTIFLSNSGAGR